MHAILAFVLVLHPLCGEAPAARETVERVVARMVESDLEELWRLSAQLEALGEDAAPLIEDALSSPSVKVRLGCAKALLSAADPGEAEVALREIADSAAPQDVRAAALVLLRSSLEKGLAPVLDRITRNDPNPLIRMEAARTLWEVAEDPDARELAPNARKVLEHFLDSADPDIRDRAAIALGEMGYVESRVNKILSVLCREPTDLGRRAALILEIERLARKDASSANPFDLGEGALLKEVEELKRQNALLREQRHGAAGEADPLLAWIRDTIRENYVEESVSELDLRIGAAKGIVQALDPFSYFMDPKETREFDESLSGSYTGIGAQIAQDGDTGWLTIVRPLAGGPARRAGLKPGDRIVEIDGVSTKGKPMSVIVGLLKGTRDAFVTLKISRRGWKELREFKIKRREIVVEDIHTRMLPGGIGYIRPDHFGERTYGEVRDALASLGREGMQGIVLDLRGNPGGLLAAAVNVVDLFVGKEERPIVEQKGRVGTKKEFSKDLEPQYLNEPMAILIDRSSASASEIVAGALQDFAGRAVLIGEKTFGKGSVQRVFGVPSDIEAELGGRAALRLTVQYYHLPSDRCIHTKRAADGTVLQEGGVVPDIPVAERTYPLWKAYEFEKLGESEALKERVQALLDDKSPASRKGLCRELLLNGDGGDPSRYPGFEELYEKVRGEVKLDRDDVRVSLRTELRRAYEDGEGRELACDFQDDLPLRRAILEILKRLSIDPRSEPAYVCFTETPPEEGEAEEGGADESDEVGSVPAESGLGEEEKRVVPARP